MNKTNRSRQQPTGRQQLACLPVRYCYEISGKRDVSSNCDITQKTCVLVILKCCFVPEHMCTFKARLKDWSFGLA